MTFNTTLSTIFLAILLFGATFGLDSVSAQEPHFVSYIADTDIGYCLAVSPDGKNVYAGGERSIVAFERMADASWRTLQVLNNHHLGVEHIEHVIDMEVSPDGRYLYAVSTINQALLIFARDTTWGTISLVEVYHDAIFTGRYEGFPSVEYRFKLLISPDGKNLYWLYHDRGVLAVFSRNQQTGAVQKIQTLKNKDAILGRYFVPTAIAIAPDGRHLYGTELNGKLLTFLRMPGTGELKLDSAMTTSITWWPRADVFVSPLDTLVYAADFDNNVVLEFFRQPENGRLEFSQEVARASAVVVLTAPDNQFVYALQHGGFAVFKKEPGSGRLTPIQFFRVPLTGSASVAMSPDGRNIFLTSIDTPEVMTILAREEQTGSWKVSQQFKQGNVGGTDGLSDSHAAVVSPNGTQVYVTSLEQTTEGVGKAGLNRFTRNPTDGRLTLSDFTPRAKLDGLLLSPEGKHLYAISTNDSSIYVFTVDSQNGSAQLVQTLHDTLKEKNSYFYLLSSRFLAFAPGGTQFYINAMDRLLVYNREIGTGKLTREQKVSVQQHGLSHEQFALAVSPDGRQVYTCGFESWSWGPYIIGIFARDSLSGRLTFAQRQRFPDLTPGPVLKVAPDGRFVYAGLQPNYYAQGTGEAVAVFARDAVSGTLTLNEVVRFPYYEMCVDVEISADSRDVYALLPSLGGFDGLIAVLERDPVSGKLSERKLLRSWENGAYGPQSPEDFALSPDGRFIYVVDAHGVGTFATGRDNPNNVSHSAGSSDNLPQRFALHANYPNPFNPTTLIKYDLPRSTEVRLTIMDVLGQVVRTLVAEKQADGSHAVLWDGKDEHGTPKASGVYLYRLYTPEFSQLRKLMLLR